VDTLLDPHTVVQACSLNTWTGRPGKSRVWLSAGPGAQIPSLLNPAPLLPWLSLEEADSAKACGSLLLGV
jgi:hypothetical protein